MASANGCGSVLYIDQSNNANFEKYWGELRHHGGKNLHFVNFNKTKTFTSKSNFKNVVLCEILSF